MLRVPCPSSTRSKAAVGIRGKRGGEEGWRDGGKLPASLECLCSPPSCSLHHSARARRVRNPKKRMLQATPCAKCLLVAFGKVFMCCRNTSYLKICCLLMPGDFSLVLCCRMEVPGLCTMFMAHHTTAYPILSLHITSHPVPALYILALHSSLSCSSSLTCRYQITLQKHPSQGTQKKPPGCWQSARGHPATPQHQKV